VRYWMSNGDGKTYGPYTIDELRSMASSGHVNDRCMLCVEGTQRWAPARTLLASNPGTPSPSAADAAVTHQQTQVQAMPYAPPTYIGPVLATLFCCVPLGLVSLVYAANANVKAARGDIAGAMGDESRSRTWLMIAVAPMFAFVIIYAVLLIRGVVRF
jgi:hypothetical protein